MQDGIDETQIMGMLQTMVKQRQESIDHYEQGGRLEMAEQEREEIAIINDFLPPRLDEAAMEAAIGSVIDELGAASIKDMGRTMAALRQRYAGQMDFGKARRAGEVPPGDLSGRSGPGGSGVAGPSIRPSGPTRDEGRREPFPIPSLTLSSRPLDFARDRLLGVSKGGGSHIVSGIP